MEETVRGCVDPNTATNHDGELPQESQACDTKGIRRNGGFQSLVPFSANNKYLRTMGSLRSNDHPNCQKQGHHAAESSGGVLIPITKGPINSCSLTLFTEADG